MDWAAENMSAAQFKEVHDQLGILNALLLTVAAGAALAGVPDTEAIPSANITLGSFNMESHVPDMNHVSRFYMFVWCAAFFAFLTGTLVAVMLSLAASETANEAQFTQLYKLLGWVKRVPYLMMMLGVVLTWFGMIAYIALTYKHDFMACCLFVCSFFWVLFDYVCRRIAWTVKIVALTQTHIDEQHVANESHRPESMAGLLDEYLEKRGGMITRVSRSGFLETLPCKAGFQLLGGHQFDEWYERLAEREMKKKC